MNYVVWALVAMAGYTLVAPLMKVALAEVPSTVAVVVSNTILVAAAVAVVAVTESTPHAHLSNPKMGYVVAAGICPAVGIIADYRAHELGPISVVVPIFGSSSQAPSSVSPFSRRCSPSGRASASSSGWSPSTSRRPADT